jgi:hypothetical protein
VLNRTSGVFGMPKKDTDGLDSVGQILRHPPSERAWTPAGHSAQHLEEVEAHVEKYIGKIETVFHEIASHLIHLDVLWVPATTERPYHVLVTSGVSDEPMKVPKEMEGYRRAELMMVLPKDWTFSELAFKDEASYWPVRWLKHVGRLPHEHDTWIGWGHTIPNDDPPTPIANTDFVGVMVSAPYWLPHDFFRLTTRAGEVISFYTLIPLYQAEMDLKLKRGAEELEKRLEKQNANFVLDTKRTNVAKSRGWLW